MHCQRLLESFLDYQAGALSDADAAAVREHLKSCLACQRAWADLQNTLLTLDRLPAETPSPRLRANVYAMIEEAQREVDAPSPFALARSRLDAFFAALLPSRPALQFAFTLALLAAGLFAGARFFRPAPVVVTQADPATQQELAALRAKVESVDRLVTTSLRQQSATSRLQGVLAAVEANGSDDRTHAQLLNTLAFDPSVNVRLFALEALYAHADRDPVRDAILAALPRERSPLVQVAMIDFVVAARDEGTAAALTALTSDPQVDAVVREAAQRGLAQL
ncbi:MAG TPA: zf-HC2 domain-containing protein [Candidatus Synoicihabitans sp.]|nr:zf-HC2 domain-containing protein [Candidatus Synoicihabitans sp.]